MNRTIFINGNPLNVDMNKFDEAFKQADEFRNFQIDTSNSFYVKQKNYWESVYQKLLDLLKQDFRIWYLEIYGDKKTKLVPQENNFQLKENLNYTKMVFKGFFFMVSSQSSEGFVSYGLVTKKYKL